MSPRSNGWYVMEPDSNSALSHSRGHTSNNEMIPFSSEAHSTVPQTQQRPRKGSYGCYSIVPGDLPVVGAVEPRGSTSFTLKGSEKGSKETDLGANCRLCSGVLWVPLTESWSANLEPYLPPLNQTQKLLPGAWTPAWTGRQFPLG